MNWSLAMANAVLLCAGMALREDAAAARVLAVAAGQQPGGGQQNYSESKTMECRPSDFPARTCSDCVWLPDGLYQTYCEDNALKGFCGSADACCRSYYANVEYSCKNCFECISCGAVKAGCAGVPSNRSIFGACVTGVRKDSGDCDWEAITDVPANP
jgi:hypothetical protein